MTRNSEKFVPKMKLSKIFEKKNIREITVWNFMSNFNVEPLTIDIVFSLKVVRGDPCSSCLDSSAPNRTSVYADKWM